MSDTKDSETVDWSQLEKSEPTHPTVGKFTVVDQDIEAGASGWIDWTKQYGAPIEGSPEIAATRGHSEDDRFASVPDMPVSLDVTSPVGNTSGPRSWIDWDEVASPQMADLRAAMGKRDDQEDLEEAEAHFPVARVPSNVSRPKMAETHQSGITKPAKYSVEVPGIQKQAVKMTDEQIDLQRSLDAALTDLAKAVGVQPPQPVHSAAPVVDPVTLLGHEIAKRSHLAPGQVVVELAKASSESMELKKALQQYPVNVDVVRALRPQGAPEPVQKSQGWFDYQHRPNLRARDKEHATVAMAAAPDPIAALQKAQSDRHQQWWRSQPSEGVHATVGDCAIHRDPFSRVNSAQVGNCTC